MKRSQFLHGATSTVALMLVGCAQQAQPTATLSPPTATAAPPPPTRGLLPTPTSAVLPTAIATAAAPSKGPLTFAKTASLALGRTEHTATRLSDGRLLVTGGSVDLGGTADGPASDTAELYDPATGTWAATASMQSRRTSHTATLLPNGRVLVVGGWPVAGPSAALSSAELYDPTSGKWTLTDSLKSVSGRNTATLLESGTVLVVGEAPNPSAELYDPATGTWSTTGSMNAARLGHKATPLADGKVLVVGRVDIPEDRQPRLTAEIYDPEMGTWVATGEPTTLTMAETATLLPNGKVLVVGAVGPDFKVPSAELYDPATGKWTSAGQPSTPGLGRTATLLRDGRVLVLGGQDGGGSSAPAELFDPATSTWTDAGRLTTARSDHTATLLDDGRVLVVGGGGRDPEAGSGYLSSCELVTVGQ